MTDAVGAGGQDRILLTGVRAWGRHGVLAEERRAGQEFVVDVCLDVGSLAPAASTDDLNRTVSYADVAAAVVGIVEGEPVDLIETLATRIADACLAFPLVRSVTVTVHKPHAPIPVTFADVAVRITRPA